MPRCIDSASAGRTPGTSLLPSPRRRAVGSWRWGMLMLAATRSLAAADTALDSFKREVEPVLTKYCYDCHGDGMDKGGVTLDDTGKAALHDSKLWLRVLRNVRAGLMPPADENHPLPAAEVEKIATWIKREAFGLDAAKPDPGRVTVRRLNRVEYRNTIRDLTGVDYDTQKEFPADDTGHGFDNIADVLTISPMLTERYLDAAQAIIGKAVVTKPRSVAEKSLYGRQFEIIKVDTKVPEPPKPAVPTETMANVAAGVPAAAATVTPAPAATAPSTATPRVTDTNVAAAPAAVAGAVVAANAPAPGTPAAGTPGAPGRGQARGGFGGRGRGAPPPATRPAPTVEDDAIILSYYTPATLAGKQRLEHAGKYQVSLDMTAQETYADNLFDLNKCRLIFTLNGQTLLDQEFVREGYSKKFVFDFERELTAGDHEFTLEIQPLGPDVPQYRKLRMRLNQVALRGPLAEQFWVKTAGYDKFFPRDTVPADAQGRLDYAREILGKFASRAFRRPADKASVDKLVALAEKVYTQRTHTFESGVAQAMVAVLAHPNFLFREDRTEPKKAGQAHPFIDEYSLASRLSYFLWSSMPDDELLELAGAQQLRANLPAQLKRMLADKKAGQFVRNFTGQWLQARDIATVPITAEAVFLRDNPNPELEQARETFQKLQSVPPGSRTAEQSAALQSARGIVFEFNRRTKPELTDPLRRAMQEETELTFAHVLREDRSLLELLDSNYTFLNETLAKHYGIEGVTGNEMRKVALPPDSPRGGVLTQGTVLAVTSNPTRTSPVKRGVFILEAILGTPPAPPPPNIPALEEAASAEQLKSLNLRDTLALHAKNAVCSSCHSRMDPLGLALENFNAMGAWRTTDMGQPVTPAGQLATGEKFADVRELKRVLSTARRHDFYHSISEKVLTYALGRSIEYYDTLTLDGIVAAVEKAEGRPSALLTAIVNSPAFQQRRESAAPTAISDASATQSTSSNRLVQAQIKP